MGCFRIDGVVGRAVRDESRYGGVPQSVGQLGCEIGLEASLSSLIDSLPYSVMEPQLSQFERLGFTLAGHSIHHAIFFSDPTRPPSAEVTLQRLRFANSEERCSHCLLDHFIDALMRFGVSGLPVKIVFPRLIRENQLHSTRSRSSTVPESS